MMMVFLAILMSYLFGSIPTAYIYGKLMRGVDIRDHGSGNVGATNVFRVFGMSLFIFCLYVKKTINNIENTLIF